jgi:hypothetical protein
LDFRHPATPCSKPPADAPDSCGIAHVLDGDDPRERQAIICHGNLARQLCVGASAAVATSPLTVRIDLNPDG